MSAGDVVAVPVEALDATYIGVAAMITIPRPSGTAGTVGLTLQGGISDVVQHDAGDVVYGFGGRNRPTQLHVAATELWLGGRGVLVPHGAVVLVDPPPAALTASEPGLDAEYEDVQRRLDDAAGGES